jgi:hypothetical protein
MGTYNTCTQQDFGHLALAIVHAGAYIWRLNRTIREYREMFLNRRQATLERYSEIPVKVDGYQKSVYTTWYISYQQLSTRAQQLLWLMAYLHHDNLTEDIFRRAVIKSQTYQPVIPASNEETQVQQHVTEYLGLYLDSTGAWDTGAFLSVMAELMSYSLISYDRVNAVYTLHVLVHDWTSTVIPKPPAVAIRHTMFLLAVSIGY